MNDKKLPGIAAEDTGKCACGIFRKGREYVGKTVGIAGEHLTGAQMAVAFTRAPGWQVRCNAIPPEAYRNLGFPAADDLGNRFQLKRDFQEAFCGARSLTVSRDLDPPLQTFETWLERNKGRIPPE